MQRHLLAFLVPVLLLAGCAVQPENLSDEAKRDIYRYVRDEVARESRAAKIAEKHGELMTAARRLARVHFLDPSQTEAGREAERLAELARSRSEEQYRRGMLALKKHKRTALLFFARALRINAEHAKAAREAALLIREPSLATEVIYLEQRIAESAAKGDSAAARRELNSLVTQLLELDVFNPVARNARDSLERVGGFVAVADSGASTSAKPLTPAQLTQMATLIRERYAAGDFRATLMLLSEFRAGIGDGSEAVAVASSLNGELAGGIPKAMEQGRALFEQKLLDEALVLFRCILAIAPDEEEARVYVRKIESRLRTIEDLG